ncbi:C6 finger domain protein [Aspergillus germanicus]
MSTPKRRFHGGCWTCKVKHRKCDRARPSCRTCEERGIVCEGYDVRLRWGVGVASRGRFTGAEAPTVASVSVAPRAKGRLRDRARGGQRQLQSAAASRAGSSVSTEADEELGCLAPGPRWETGGRLDDEPLFQEFLSSGINILHSTTVHDVENLLKSRISALIHQSSALYTICITLQISLKPELKMHFFEYFDAALTKFRSELRQNETYLEDGTLAAGLLLCTIGVRHCSFAFTGALLRAPVIISRLMEMMKVMHGIPWTMHLRGMYSILQLSSVDHAHHGPDKTFRRHLCEVMGIMDLPTFAIGRQYPHLNFWRQYCRSRLSDHDDVEVVSGLPRSLVDIFSSIGDGATEEDFWNWPGALGSIVQCQLWEAHRLAGMLAIRDSSLHSSLRNPETRNQPGGRVVPSTTVLVSRLISCIDAVHRASVEPDARGTLAINALPYPIFVAGLQVGILTEYPALKQSVRSFLLPAAAEPFWNKQYQIILDLLEEYWTCAPGTVNIHQLAQAREIELGLF